MCILYKNIIMFQYSNSRESTCLLESEAETESWLPLILLMILPLSKLNRSKGKTHLVAFSTHCQYIHLYGIYGRIDCKKYGTKHIRADWNSTNPVCLKHLDLIIKRSKQGRVIRWRVTCSGGKSSNAAGGKSLSGVALDVGIHCILNKRGICISIHTPPNDSDKMSADSTWGCCVRFNYIFSDVHDNIYTCLFRDIP